MREIPHAAFLIRLVSVLGLAMSVSCAASAPITHGKITTLSAATRADSQRCIHHVPAEVCAQCNPHLVSKFKESKDWCPEHGIPESQCFACHPDLSFDPLPPLPKGADLREISEAGEDVTSLDAHVVAGKVTLFDFHAVWCAPCRKVDAHVFPKLGANSDIAVRKLNVVSWDTPLAKRYLQDIAALPHVVVFGKDGRRVGAVSGLDLPALDKMIEEARRP